MFALDRFDPILHLKLKPNMSHINQVVSLQILVPVSSNYIPLNYINQINVCERQNTTIKTGC